MYTVNQESNQNQTLLNNIAEDTCTAFQWWCL